MSKKLNKSGSLLLLLADNVNYRVSIRVSQKHFFEFRFAGRITGANGCPEATKNFSVIDPSTNLAIDFNFGPFLECKNGPKYATNFGLRKGNWG